MRRVWVYIIAPWLFPVFLIWAWLNLHADPVHWDGVAIWLGFFAAMFCLCAWSVKGKKN
jgi:hypothetical protein